SPIEAEPGGTDAANDLVVVSSTASKTDLGRKAERKITWPCNGRLHANGKALDKDGSQDHCAKDASGGRNGGVASHRRKHRFDPDIDYCGGRFDCLLGEQAIKAYPARKLS